MNKIVAISVLLVASVAVPAYAHRVDEYLQATIVSVEKERIEFSMRLVPGIAVSSDVIASIDRNRDGVLSDAERQAYTEQVLQDLSLKINGSHLKPQLRSVHFPTMEEMKEGLGEIQIEFAVNLPPAAASRTLTVENHHQRRIAAYMVNCLVPHDPDIRVIAQHRDELQSFYQLDYVQNGGSVPRYEQWLSAFRSWTGTVGLASIFRLGMRHIAEGTDHLLFLLTLLLPAPLLVARARWMGFAGLRHSLVQTLRVVTAFTVGHSITLALSALGVVRVPSRPIEVLIAVSILASALHTLRPIFPGREGGIAALFGLVHGFAFANTVSQLGFGWWQRLLSVLGFNLGIETMQLIVVAATMPSLILLSQTRVYPGIRIVGGLFAACASVGWICERLLNLHTPMDVIVDTVAHHAVWLAGAAFLISIVGWSLATLVETPAKALSSSLIQEAVTQGTSVQD